MMSVSEWRLKKTGLTVTGVGLVRVLYPTDVVWACSRSLALIVLDGQTIPSGVEPWMLPVSRRGPQPSYLFWMFRPCD